MRQVDAGPMLTAIGIRLRELERLARIADSLYEACAGCYVRKYEVAEMVAERLGRAPSPPLQRDLKAALERAGWASVRHQNRSLWRGRKLRCVSVSAARMHTMDMMAHITAWRRRPS